MLQNAVNKVRILNYVCTKIEVLGPLRCSALSVFKVLGPQRCPALSVFKVLGPQRCPALSVFKVRIIKLKRNFTFFTQNKRLETLLDSICRISDSIYDIAPRKCMYVYKHIQGDSGGICTTLGNDSMSDSKQKSS